MKTVGTRWRIRAAAVLLFVLMLLPLLPEIGLSAQAEIKSGAQFKRKSLSGLNARNWMSGIDGERLITEINLPGTHDSGTSHVMTSSNVSPLYWKYAQCQDLTIEEQLNAGVRYLDIRLSNNVDYRVFYVFEGQADDGVTLALAHGDHQGLINGRFFCLRADEKGVYNKYLRLADVLETVAKFLRANPTETVILCMSRETGTKGLSGGELDKIIYPRIKNHLDLFSKYVYHPDGPHEEMPKLDQCRGKMVILTGNPKAAGYGTKYVGSQCASTVDEGAGYPTMWLGNQVTYFENHYEAKDKEKEQWVRKFYETHRDVNIPADPTVRIGHANLVQISSNAFAILSGGRYPSEIAGHMNPVVFTGANPIVKERGRLYGWILSDFITEEIARDLWSTNYPNHVHHLSGPSEGIAPTCTSKGKKAYYTCKDCGKLFLDGQGILEVKANDLTIPDLGGHEPKAPVAEKIVPATKDADGHYEEVVRCSRCGDVISRKTVELKDRPTEKSVPYVDEYGTTRYCNDYTWFDTLPVRGGWGIGTNGWFVVRKTQEISKYRMTISGHVNLILQDGATLTIYPGIRLTPGGSLTVWGQSGQTGRLISTSGTKGYAGIGGDRGEAAGTFIMHSGNVGAQGGKSAAGIGGGDDGRGGGVIIYGGDVNGLGGDYGAGIGGGEDGDGGNVTIYGGKVNARGGGKAAGIGGGYAGSQGGKVVIYGGTVTATGGAHGAGIGGGEYYRGGGMGGHVTIYGGKVTAIGGEEAAGIGGGEGGNQNGEVQIKSGEVIAEGGSKGAGIGGGKKESDHGGIGAAITISSGTVTAIGNAEGGGIGNGGSPYDEMGRKKVKGRTYIQRKEQQGFNGTLKMTGGKLLTHSGNVNNIWFDHKDAYYSKIGGPASTAMKISSVALSDSLRIRTGDSEASLTTANKEVRKNVGRTFRWAVIDPCTHENATIIASEKGHLIYCQNCKIMLNGEEPHDFENGFCKVCHTKAKVFYQISFDPNGGSGTMKNEKIPGEQGTYRLPACGYEPSDPANQFFAGWESGGRTYQPGDEISISGNTTVKAVWDVCHHRTVTRTTVIDHCTEPGYTERKVYCTLCYTVMSTSRTRRSPTGHHWSEWIVLEDPNGEQPGRAIRVCENDPSHIEYTEIRAAEDTAFHYYVSAEGMTWKKNSGQALTFHFHRSRKDNETYEHFTGLVIDDAEELKKGEDYKAVKEADGSLEIQMMPKYLKLLEPGWHDLTVWFSDGETDAEFLVEEESEIPKPQPKEDLEEGSLVHDLIIPDPRTKKFGTVGYAIGSGVMPPPVDEVAYMPEEEVDYAPEGQVVYLPEIEKEYRRPTMGEYRPEIPRAGETGVYFIWTLLLGDDGYTDQDPEQRPVPVVIEGKDYKVVSGQEQIWTVGSTESLSFTVKRTMNDAVTFDRFKQLEINRKKVDPSDYEIEPGSLILRLKASRLSTLQAGYHELVFVFGDGNAATYFEVAQPQTETFTFRKKWVGSAVKDVEFILYQSDGKKVPVTFNRRVISQGDWEYTATIASALPCYVIEKPMKGYTIRYANSGAYADKTDRCYNGGTIINRKLPRTGDGSDPRVWVGCVLAGLMILGLEIMIRRRRKGKGT